MPIWSDLAHIDTHTKFSSIVARLLRLDILVVTDTIVSFGPEQDPRNLNESFFGMGHLMGVLESVGAVTRAHRANDPLTAPNVIPNFRFHQHNLSQYDQIWLLGYGTGTLPVEEQAAIAAFMNTGGGVFATGDHASLGSLLAGALPRVRSMRHWASPPPPLGADRVDTTRPDVNDVVVFENQSDDIPQQLRLRWYTWSTSRWMEIRYPHPLLCSRNGAITEFPDHMHEGEIVVPTVLDGRMSYPGVAEFDEYPPGPDGQRVSPEVVAWCWTTGRTDPEVMHGIHVGDPGVSNARWTGAVGAYDGHRAGVGRVVVDSTWHHFFDINLIGDNAANRPGFNDPRAPLWRQGFMASANGQRILGQIDQYFRNIANWLSPNANVWQRFVGLVAQISVSHKMREVLDGGVTSNTAIGAYAWEHALIKWPPCAVLDLVSIALEEFVPLERPPWDGPVSRDAPFGILPPLQVAQAALGGAVLAFSKLKSIDALERDSAHALREGAVAAVMRLYEEEHGRLQKAEKWLAAALRTSVRGRTSAQ